MGVGPMDDSHATHGPGAPAGARTSASSADRDRPATARRPPSSAASFVVRWAQLTALVAFAVAQPLYDVLERHPTFLALHGVRTVEAAVAIALAQFGLPALGALWLRALASRRPRAELALRAFLVGAAAVLTALPPLQRGLPDARVGPAVAALAIGVAFGSAFVRWATLRLYVAGLAIASAVFATSFLLGLRSGAVRPPAPVADERAAAPIPIVLVVFDELPLASLLAPDGSVDERRFPSFGRLARTSTWFANTTTPHPTTRTAIPALFTGRVIRRSGSIPTWADHPGNLFTWLGRTHELEVSGSIRELCPEDRRGTGAGAGTRLGTLLDDLAIVWAHVVTPRAWRAKLPPVDDTWVDFRSGDPRERRDAWRERLLGITSEDRAGRLRAFTERLTPRSEPALYALHLVLPHAPWAYLPSGRAYAAPRKERLADVALERYLLQLAFADRLLGELLDALETRGLWDAALVVVTADHGASFVTADRRRRPTPTRLPDIAFVPLFVKRPGQTAGHRDERPAQTVDVAPTILDVVGLERPPDVDGRSLFAADPEPEPARFLWRESGGDPLELGSTRPEPTPLGERIDALFAAEPGPGGWPVRHDEQGIVGRPVASLDVRPGRLDVALRLDVWGRDEPRPGWAACYVTGRGSRALPDRIALAVDGVVVAVARRAPGEEGGEAVFGALVPPGRLDDPSAVLRAFGLDRGPPVSLLELE